VSQAGVHAPESSRGQLESPARALSSVVDNVTALARAEVKLAAAEARAWLVRVGLGLGLLWLSLLLFQVFVLTLALAPIMLVDKPWANVAWMVGLSAVPTLLVSVLALRELQKLKETRNEPDAHDIHRH
jgi:Putative Actinobacterial Holin-X, holin superfamily III